MYIFKSFISDISFNRKISHTHIYTFYCNKLSFFNTIYTNKVSKYMGFCFKIQETNLVQNRVPPNYRSQQSRSLVSVTSKPKELFHKITCSCHPQA